MSDDNSPLIKYVESLKQTGRVYINVCESEDGSRARIQQAIQFTLASKMLHKRLTAYLQSIGELV